MKGRITSLLSRKGFDTNNEKACSAINIGSYLSALVSLNLLKDMRKRDKMRGLPIIVRGSVKNN